MDFTGKLPTSHGEKVVLCGSPDKRESDEKIDVTKAATTSAKAHEMQLKNLLMRSMMSADRWHGQHTAWLWIARICSTPRQCSCEPWKHL